MAFVQDTEEFSPFTKVMSDVTKEKKYIGSRKHIRS